MSTARNYTAVKTRRQHTPKTESERERKRIDAICAFEARYAREEDPFRELELSLEQSWTACPTQYWN